MQPAAVITDPTSLRAPLNALQPKVAIARQPHVLVVDDDPDVARLVRTAMHRYKIFTESALSGAEALAHVRDRPPSLVLLDLGMPGLDGFDILLALKVDPNLQGMPVIMLTANADESAIAQSFGYGADDYVTKPFRPGEVAMRVYRLLHPYRPKPSWPSAGR